MTTIIATTKKSAKKIFTVLKSSLNERNFVSFFHHLKKVLSLNGWKLKVPPTTTDSIRSLFQRQLPRR